MFLNHHHDKLMMAWENISSAVRFTGMSMTGSIQQCTEERFPLPDRSESPKFMLINKLKCSWKRKVEFAETPKNTIINNRNLIVDDLLNMVLFSDLQKYQRLAFRGMSSRCERISRSVSFSVSMSKCRFSPQNRFSFVNPFTSSKHYNLFFSSSNKQDSKHNLKNAISRKCTLFWILIKY